MSGLPDEELHPFDREFFLNRAVALMTPETRQALHAACREEGVSVYSFYAGRFDLDEAILEESTRAVRGFPENEPDLTELLGHFLG